MSTTGMLTRKATGNIPGMSTKQGTKVFSPEI